MRVYDLSKKHWQWITILALAFVWGSSFILMKKGLRSFNYMQVAGLRVFLSFIILSPFYLRFARKVTRKNVLHLMISGYTGIFFPAFLFTKAQTNIDSSLAGMINSLAPFFALITGILIYKNRPTKYQYIGIALGFIGALGLINNGGSFTDVSIINKYALYVVLATLCYGINANEIKYKLSGLTGVEITTLSLLFVGPPAGIYLAFSDFGPVMQSPTWLVDLGFILFLALFGSVISLFFFNNLVHRTSAVFATSVTYIIPFFAILWGISDGEHISWIQVLSIAIALTGVYIVSLRNGNKAKLNSQTNEPVGS